MASANEKLNFTLDLIFINEMNGHMWLVIAVLDSMGLRVNRVKYVNYVSRRQEECAGRRKNVCKSPVARGSTACLRT